MRWSFRGRAQGGRVPGDYGATGRIIGGEQRGRRLRLVRQVLLDRFAPYGGGKASAVEDHVERAAYNEAVFRAANEALRGSAGHARGPLLAFLCECGDEACKEKIELTGDEYAAVRAHAAHFALRPGHEGAGEYVVERRGRFSVVEKVGAARRVVE